jgi:hypothetical protein
MIQGGGGLGLALEPAQGLRIAGDIIGQELESNEAMQSVSSALYTTPMPPPPSFSTMR